MCEYENIYDYLNCRIRQKVILKSGATGQTQSGGAYVYDGWNVVGVYDTTTATPSFQKGYLWGEDLSGSLQGAGGVGGLLAEKRGGQTYLPVYDGNGNIMSYLNASTRASVAEYVYDAFGRTISSSGTEADNFTCRFSTKSPDGSGLYYYGCHYYDPQHGHWISRDPIEENGGVNLYGFVGNNGVDEYDIYGLKKCYRWMLITFYNGQKKVAPGQTPGSPLDEFSAAVANQRYTPPPENSSKRNPDFLGNDHPVNQPYPTGTIFHIRKGRKNNDRRVVRDTGKGWAMPRSPKNSEGV